MTTANTAPGGTAREHAAPRAPRTPRANRWALGLLGSWLRPVIDGSLGAVCYTARSGAAVTLPVQIARDGDRAVVLAGRADRKRWWRHFTSPARAAVLVDGGWQPATGRVARGEETAAAYRRSYPRVTVPRDATFVVFIFDQAPPERPRLRGRALWRAWFAAVTVAEFVGFAVPATVGALTVSTSPWLAVPALLAAGAVEGAMLGGGQAAVLRQAVAGLPARWWVAATTAGAVLAYAIGMAPSTFGAANWPAAAFVALAVPGGAALLLSIGVAQWLVLRRHIPRAGRWIVATAAAWIVGLVVFLAFAMPLWQPGQPTVLVIAIGAVGGLLMAATVAAVTGTALRRILA